MPTKGGKGKIYFKMQKEANTGLIDVKLTALKGVCKYV